MKDELIKLVKSEDGIVRKKNTLREYLQAYILKTLYNNNFFQYCTFHGGTCLRFVHNTKRFSEDLDFALTKNQPEFSFDETINRLKIELEGSGYSIKIRGKSGTVVTALIRFSALLSELDLSHRKEEYFSIKIELDRNPPSGGNTQTDIINKYFMIGLTSYDLPTLYAGKINAILTREFTKGRDYYDLFWYLVTHKNLLPDFIFLKNALAQFGWNTDFPNQRTWKNKMVQVIQEVDWKIVSQDVEVLLEDPGEVDIFTKQNALNLLLK